MQAIESIGHTPLSPLCVGHECTADCNCLRHTVLRLALVRWMVVIILWSCNALQPTSLQISFMTTLNDNFEIFAIMHA